jgi:hypothetical protein
MGILCCLAEIALDSPSIEKLRYNTNPSGNICKMDVPLRKQVDKVVLISGKKPGSVVLFIEYQYLTIGSVRRISSPAQEYPTNWIYVHLYLENTETLILSLRTVFKHGRIMGVYIFLCFGFVYRGKIKEEGEGRR